jgi:hypothetical protein
MTREDVRFGSTSNVRFRNGRWASSLSNGWQPASGSIE